MDCKLQMRETSSRTSEYRRLLRILPCIWLCFTKHDGKLGPQRGRSSAILRLGPCIMAATTPSAEPSPRPACLPFSSSQLVSLSKRTQKEKNAFLEAEGSFADFGTTARKRSAASSSNAKKRKNTTSACDHDCHRIRTDVHQQRRRWVSKCRREPAVRQHDGLLKRAREGVNVLPCLDPGPKEKEGARMRACQ